MYSLKNNSIRNFFKYKSDVLMFFIQNGLYTLNLYKTCFNKNLYRQKVSVVDSLSTIRSLVNIKKCMFFVVLKFLVGSNY